MSPTTAHHVQWQIPFLLAAALATIGCGDSVTPTSDAGPSDAGSSECGALGGDPDGDGVCSTLDNCPGASNADQLDSDEDGRGDVCDATPFPCDDAGGDVDMDGVCGLADNCPDIANGSQLDQDGDGQGDRCDDSPLGSPCRGVGGDADGDEVCQSGDNCPDEPNADQRDSDGDGTGDACDPTPNPCDDHGGDSDGDTICDAFDNCPDTSNMNQLDLDLDGVGDVCDPTPPVIDPAACRGAGGDLDGDGWCGVDDNCPNDSNPTQADTDGDGVGDACDPEVCDGGDDDGDGSIDEGFPDDDGDGVANCNDYCFMAPDTDDDGDGIVDCIDACPGDAANDEDGDNVCSSVDNCPLVSNYRQTDTDDDGIGDACQVESCDGLDNDGDGQTDEGFPDADGDSICDDADACPGDAVNDPDEDGVCALTDNCPSDANSSQSDADGDGSGDACDLDFACDPAVPLNPVGTVVIPANTEIATIVADPGRDLIYGVARSSSAGSPNRLLAIDPTTLTVRWSMAVGSDPDQLAISDDGSRLYVGLRGANLVRAIDLVRRRACGTFGVGSYYRGPKSAGEMHVLPGAPETLVVSTQRYAVSPSFGGVFVYDEGRPRPEGTRDHTGAQELVVASATTAYGYNSLSTEYGFRQMIIDERGIREDWVVRSIVSGFQNDIAYFDGRVFSLSGGVIDPTVPQVLGSIPASGPVIGVPADERAYYATGVGTLAVGDLTTYTVLREDPLPAGSTPARELERHGSSDLVILATDGTLHFVSGVLVP